MKRRPLMALPEASIRKHKYKYEKYETRTLLKKLRATFWQLWSIEPTSFIEWLTPF